MVGKYNKWERRRENTSVHVRKLGFLITFFNVNKNYVKQSMGSMGED